MDLVCLSAKEIGPILLSPLSLLDGGSPGVGPGTKGDRGGGGGGGAGESLPLSLSLSVGELSIALAAYSGGGGGGAGGARSSS